MFFPSNAVKMIFGFSKYALSAVPLPLPVIPWSLFPAPPTAPFIPQRKGLFPGTTEPVSAPG